MYQHPWVVSKYQFSVLGSISIDRKREGEPRAPKSSRLKIYSSKFRFRLQFLTLQKFDVFLCKLSESRPEASTRRGHDF